MSTTNSNASSSLATLKLQSKARENEEKQYLEKKRGTLVLVMHHLLTSGFVIKNYVKIYRYLDTATMLQQECGMSLKQYEVADNVDLQTIICEFEEYFTLKFNKRPRLFRKIECMH